MGVAHQEIHRVAVALQACRVEVEGRPFRALEEGEGRPSQALEAEVVHPYRASEEAGVRPCRASEEAGADRPYPALAVGEAGERLQGRQVGEEAEGEELRS